MWSRSLCSTVDAPPLFFIRAADEFDDVEDPLAALRTRIDSLALLTAGADVTELIQNTNGMDAQRRTASG